MGLEEEFNEAADVVQRNSLEGSVKLEEKKLLELYGLYKVGTIGPCNESQPGIFNLKGRAKWSAWKQASEFSNDDAQTRYIELVKSLLKWKPSETCLPSKDVISCKKGESFGPILGMGNSVSSFLVPTDDVEEKDVDPAFSWARDNDLVNLEHWVSSASNINIQDKDGLSPLHWAVDRGHLPACKLLLEHGADPSLKDNDGSNALEYAETCEYDNLIELITPYLNK